MGACASMLGLGFSKSEALAPIEAQLPSSPNPDGSKPPVSVPANDGGVAQVQNEETDENKCENNEEAEGNDVTRFPELQKDDPKRRSLGILFQESDSPKQDVGNNVEVVDDLKTENAVSVKGNHSTATVKNMAELMSTEDIHSSDTASENNVVEIMSLEEEKHSSEAENKLMEIRSVEKEKKHLSESVSKLVEITFVEEEKNHLSEAVDNLVDVTSVKEEEKHSSESADNLVDITSVKEEEKHSSEAVDNLVDITSFKEEEKHSSEAADNLVDITYVEEEKKHSSEAVNKLVEITSVEEEKKHSSEAANKLMEISSVEEEKKHSSEAADNFVDITSVEEEKHSSEAVDNLVDITSVKEEKKHSSETEKKVTEFGVEGDWGKLEVKNPESTLVILEAKTDEFVEEKVVAVVDINLIKSEASENGIQKGEPHENPSDEVIEVSEIEGEEGINIVELVKQDVIAEKRLNGVMEVKVSEKPNGEMVEPACDGVTEIFEVPEKPSDELLKQEPSEETNFKVVEALDDQSSVQSELKSKNSSEVEKSQVLEANLAREDVK